MVESMPIKRLLLSALALFAAALGAGCTQPAPRWVAAANQAAATQPPMPLAERIQQAMAAWPHTVHWTFFTTIHAAGNRTTASGVVDYRDPQHVRMTAVTEMGMILFDARITPDGVQADRLMPGLSASIVKDFVRDLALAFHTPANLADLKISSDRATLTEDHDDHTYHYTFGPDGRLRQTVVDVGLFDTVNIQYLRYNARGWPVDVTVSRPLRAYSLELSFTHQDAQTP
jgi:hypothetical protein